MRGELGTVQYIQKKTKNMSWKIAIYGTYIPHIHDRIRT